MNTAAETVAYEKSLNSTSLVTVIVILATVTMTFGALIAVFFYRSLAPKYWGHLDIPPLLYVSTLLLLLSSYTFERGKKVLLERDQPGFYKWIRYTLVLAVLFLAGQVLAWWQLFKGGLVLNKNPHSWFIFLFTGLHGAHIVAGILGIAYLLVRTREPASGPKYQMQTRVVARSVAFCWHYLDFLWVVLFLLLLTWRR